MHYAPMDMFCSSFNFFSLKFSSLFLVEIWKTFPQFSFAGDFTRQDSNFVFLLFTTVVRDAQLLR